MEYIPPSFMHKYLRHHINYLTSIQEIPNYTYYINYLKTKMKIINPIK